MSKVDLHLHSNYSDGTDSVSELITKIQSAGIEIFALCDHDITDGCIEVKKYIKDNLIFIPSVELTCREKGVECHILGLNCKPDNEELKNLIKKGKLLRKIKLDNRIKYLKDAWNIELSQDEKDWLYSRHSVVKTHIANILVKRKLADNNLSAMKKYLDGCPAEDIRFGGEEAINAIKAAGGIAIWAHPLGGEGEIHIKDTEFYQRYEILKSIGIEGLECYYSRYSMTEIDFLVSFAKKEKIYISGGSDYHGGNKDVPFGKLNSDNICVDSKLLTVLEKIL